MRSKKGRPHVRRKTQGRQRSKYDAILGRTYGSRHLLSLERTGYYIQGKPKSQASNIVFSSDFPPAMPQSGEPKSSPIAKLLRSERPPHRNSAHPANLRPGAASAKKQAPKPAARRRRVRLAEFPPPRAAERGKTVFPAACTPEKLRSPRAGGAHTSPQAGGGGPPGGASAPPGSKVRQICWCSS